MLIHRGVNVEGNVYTVEVPDACPVCHRHSEVQFVVAGIVDAGQGVQIVFRCAYQQCKAFFVCLYGKVGSEKLLAVRPMKPPPHPFPETVESLSPMFVSTFKEALEATTAGLKGIAGPGYRKAFEFLIKDYAKSLVGDDAAKKKRIEESFSGQVVKEFIQDTRIQALAKRSLWLGNDETHYLRKWTDHDVDDLVNLIKLTTNWIEIEQVSKKYVESMPEGGA